MTNHTDFTPSDETIQELLNHPDLDFMIEELYRQLQDGEAEGQSNV